MLCARERETENKNNSKRWARERLLNRRFERTDGRNCTKNARKESMDSTAESGGWQFAKQETRPKLVGIMAEAASFIKDGRKQLTRQKVLCGCVCGPKQTQRGPGENEGGKKKRGEEEKRPPRIRRQFGVVSFGFQSESRRAKERNGTKKTR